MGEPVTLKREDWPLVLLFAAVVLAAIFSGGVLAWIISGRPIALLLGTVVFPLALVWTRERLMLRGGQWLAATWVACGVVGVAARVLPGRFVVPACLAVVTGIEVESWFDHRRIRAAAAARAREQERRRQGE